MKKITRYLLGLLNDPSGKPSAKKCACAAFGLTAIALAFCRYDAEVVGLFLAATLGANITGLFKGGKNVK